MMQPEDRWLTTLFAPKALETLQRFIADPRASAFAIATSMVSGAVALLESAGFTDDEQTRIVTEAVIARKRAKG